jgi:enoyl-CoA hydratase
MSYSHILFDIAEDGIALLTVNRPQKLNALNRAVMGELDDAFGRVASEAAIHGLILTGSGERAFVAGADIGEIAETPPVLAQEMSLRGQRVIRRLETMGKPSIAAINGWALGGGLELALACSMRIATPAAKLGQPEVKLGIIAGYGGTQRLPRLIGRGRALEMLLTGEPVDAAEAHRIGLVNHVIPAGELVDFARTLLRKIFANGPVAVALSMQAVDIGLNCGLEEGLRQEASAFGIVSATVDRREGTRAFLEKRAPQFTGK